MNPLPASRRLTRKPPRAAYVLLLLYITPFPLRAAPIDESKLPPPATNQVDFLRDIKPILDASCLKCHGPEKPKSKFRVDDRDALLKGGENGVDVIPGQSAKSPLIHYVARLVEDLEMPPAGKGDPLSREQIALLRAWIDQGVAWTAVEPASKEEFSISPVLGGISVDGNERKFREHNWINEGVNLGLVEFSLKEQIDADRKWTVAGRALRDDYKVALSLERNEVGFTRVGFERYRKYYDDAGGYYQPFTPAEFRLDRDLYLDIGRFWAEVGTTQPQRPQIVLGYEYQFTEGAKSLLQWLPVSQAGVTRNIFPASKDIDQHLNLIRLDLKHELKGIQIDNNFRFEFYDLDTDHSTVVPDQAVSDPLLSVKEGLEYQRWANALRLEKQVKEWWLLSAGYLYTALDGDASFRATSSLPGPLDVGTVLFGNDIVLEQSSHIFNFNTQLGPWRELTFSAGLQTEWGRQEGYGRIGLDDGDDTNPTPFIPGSVSANLDRFTSDENFGLRYTGIPYTVIFAEARFRQEQIGQHEDQTGGGPEEFLRDTDACSNWQEYRAGFNISPWRRVSFNARYRYRDRHTSYDDRLDEMPIGVPGSGYSAFIRSRDITSDDVELKLVYRPTSWLKTTLGYKLAAMDYETGTDPVPPLAPGLPSITTGSRVHAGNYDAHVYSLSAALTPIRRLSLSATFSVQDTRTVAEDNGSASVVPYHGQVYSVIAGANYVLNEKTDLHASYFFSRADYSQNNEADGLPLGIEYERHGLQVGVGRQIQKNLRLNLQYGYYFYEEPSQGGFSDYTAHALFATLIMKWQ